MDLLGVKHFFHRESRTPEPGKGYTCWVCGAYYESPMEFLAHLKLCVKE